MLSNHLILCCPASSLFAFILNIHWKGWCWSWSSDTLATWWKELTVQPSFHAEDLRIPWTSRRSNQAILKKISLGYSLEGLMLKLKLQYFGHLIRRAHPLERPWCWERFKAGEEGDDRGQDGWMASPTHEFEQALGDSEGQGGLACYSHCGGKESDTTVWLNNNINILVQYWYTTLWFKCIF